MAVREIILVETINPKQDYIDAASCLSRSVKYHKSFKPFGFCPMGTHAEDVRRAIVQLPTEEYPFGEAVIVVADGKKDLVGINTIDDAKKLCDCDPVVSVRTSDIYVALHNPMAANLG